MGQIIHLPPEIIAKIAAGEVIERPAYAVKELIENALDAQATSIRVEIEQSGLKKIQVIDNGSGMSREDLEECWKLHTTSKITADDPLFAIKSYGFRGEALASIAAMSTVTIRSKEHTAIAGTEIRIQQGSIDHLTPLGMPEGTTVIVENLFATVPARKQFMKSLQTEFRHILDVVIAEALAYPDRHFVLTHNKRVIFDVAKNQSLTERIGILLGPSLATHLLPVTFTDTYCSIAGFITTPQITTPATAKSHLFINKRKITDKTLLQAVKDAYGTLLEQTAYPYVILSYTLPHELVDVNVHPRKEQVAFTDLQGIITSTTKAITISLQQHNVTFANLSWKGRGSDDQHHRPGNTRSFAGELLRSQVLTRESLTKRSKSADILQLHSLYLVTPTADGFLLIDQHAAHERILYEAFKAAFLGEKQKKDLYTLPKPQLLELSLSEALLLAEHRQTFTQLGFQIERFLKQSFQITAVPLLFKDRDIVHLVHEMLADMQQELLPKAIDTQNQKMLAYLACRSAIMAGEVLTKERMRELITQLEQTANNATCPHGRPTHIALSLGELHKLFKRK